ncbi:unnamed protein product [Diamesa serratosioi]
MNTVEIKSACKYYGSKKEPKIVLDGLDMTVKKCTIYALIGSSGCGKTTLLSTIIGELYLNSGTVNVLGINASEVPRLKIGYMPQEIHLADDLTLKQLFYYFGRVCGLNNNKIEERLKFLCNLLDLSGELKPIGEFSGGEKRRISLMIALLHEPELLILDEPTVGLDALLRDKVWTFLIDSCKKGCFTVIITTHYIQEAIRADCVNFIIHQIGLLRNGKMLLEDCPTKILQTFNVDSLEKVYFIMSTKQDQQNSVEKRDVSFDKVKRKKNSSYRKDFQLRNIKALMTKNFIQFNRIDLTDMNVTVVNEEIVDFAECLNSTLKTTFHHNNTCDLNKISCRFIKHLNNSSIKYNMLLNMNDVNMKTTDAVVFFASNYTASYTDVLEKNLIASDGSIDNSKVQIFVSRNNVFVDYFVKNELLKSTNAYIDELYVDCGMSLKLITLFNFHEPIFGTKEYNFRYQMGIPMEMVLLFTTAGMLSITSILKDRLEGLWSRSLNAGVSDNELLVAHIFTQLILILIQLIFMATAFAHVFKLQNRGFSLTLICLMILVQFAGTSFGLLISVASKKYVDANQIYNFVILCLIYLCDSVCPFEGIPKSLQVLMSVLPFTKPSRAFINITIKGFTLQHPTVYLSFAILFVWIIIFLVSSWCVLKFRKAR